MKDGLTVIEQFRKAVLNHKKNNTVASTEKIFNKSASTIYRWHNQYAEEKTLAPKKRGGAHNVKIKAEEKGFFKELLDVKNDLTLKELQLAYYEKYNKRIGLSTISDELKRQGITRKKKFL